MLVIRMTRAGSKKRPTYRVVPGIAGESHGTAGAVQRPDTEPLYLDVHLPAGSRFELHATGGDLLRHAPLVVLVDEGSASAAGPSDPVVSGAGEPLGVGWVQPLGLVALPVGDKLLSPRAIEGCIDEIVFMPDRILVIDDKPGDMAWPGSRMQAWGYCVAFEEQYGPTLPIMAGIRGQDTGYEVWAQPLAQGHREEVQRAVFRIRQLIDGEAIPVGTRNRRKCKACRLAASCDVKAE